MIAKPHIVWHTTEITRKARARAYGHQGVTVWMTGLSGSGKSTIAARAERLLVEKGLTAYVLDGDNVRHGLNRDLGFTDADRVENIRRVAEAAKLFVDAGMIVLVSFISPFRSERRVARELVAKDEFLEVFIVTPIEVCMARDPKGLYKRAKAGEIKNFTGIDSPYEPPEAAEIHVRTVNVTAEDAADQIIARLRAAQIVP